MLTPFHLAYHVTSLDEARAFYGGTLGCREGRSTETWVDFDFFGHQISLHLGEPFKTTNTGKVGDHMVPMPHLGLVLHLPDWKHVVHGQIVRRCMTGCIIRPNLWRMILIPRDLKLSTVVF